MQRNPHSYQIATGYRTFYSLSLIYQPITKKRLFFTKKTLSQSDSIEPADQARFFPYFHTGCKTLFMQAGVGFHDILSQPCSRFFHPQITASLNHFMKCLVKTNSVSSFVHKGTHGVGNVNLVRENHKSFQGTPPLYLFLTESIPGKYAIGIGKDEAVYREVTTHSQ